MTSTSTDALVGFLRALGAAVGTARLHAEDRDRPEVAEVVARAEAVGSVAAQQAADGGAREASVANGVLHVEGQRVAAEANLERLADACYERRIEHVVLHGPPSADDLRVALDVLLTMPDALATEAAPGDFLAARGVATLSLRTGVPRPTGGTPDPLSGRQDLQAAAPAALPDRDDLDVIVGSRPDDTAATLYERLRAVHEAMSEDTAGRSSFFREAAKVVAELSDDERAVFGRMLLSRAGDRFADHYLGHLTDFALATFTLELAAAEGRAATEVAREVVQRSARHHDIVHLVDTMVVERDASLDPLVLDAVGSVDETTARELRERFPTELGEVRELSRRSLSDYAQLEDDAERFDRVMSTMSDRLAQACHERDIAEVHDLCATLDALTAAGSPDPGAVDACRAGALEPALLADLAVQATRSGDLTAALDLLTPFGDAAVDGLVGALEAADAPNVRGAVVSLLVSVGRDRVSRLRGHLGHPEWYVARNVTAALSRIGTSEAVAALAVASRHDHEAVRREAVRGLVASVDAEAAAALAAAVEAAHGRRERAALLAALAEHPSDTVPSLLHALAGNESPLPRWHRRKARRLARARTR